MPTTKDFKLEELSKYFHLPEKAVAKELGICLTSLKKLCRSYGITRWPFRKLKSIQRTLAKVQDEASNPSMSAQFVAAGLALPGNEGAAAAFAAQQAASAGAAGAAGKSGGVSTGATSSADAAGAHTAVAAQEAAKVPVLPVVPVEGHVPLPATGGRGGVVRKRKPFQIGGRTLMMTEEEKSIYELTIGKTGVQVATTPIEPANVGAHKAQSAQITASARADNPSRALHASSTQDSGSVTPKDRQFRCAAVAKQLEITNWAILWTQEHLQKRLLEPLGGKGMHFSADNTVAYLSFENERTSQRAELICRAAAAAAEKNLRAASGSVSPTGGTPREHCSSTSPTQSRSSLPLAVLEGITSKGGAASAMGKGHDAFKGRSSDSAAPKMKLEIPGSAAGVGGGAGGPSTSPVFKSQPVTPPSTDTAYPFESDFDTQFQFKEGNSFSALLMPASSLGFDFQNHDASSCVEVSSTSIMGTSEDMSTALLASTSMVTSLSAANLAISAEPDELLSHASLSGHELLTRSPPLTAQSHLGSSSSGGGGKDSQPGSSGDMALAAAGRSKSPKLSPVAAVAAVSQGLSPNLKAADPKPSVSPGGLETVNPKP